MDTLTVTLMLGVHQDPRLADLPVFYGLGSYIPHPIPETFTYLYIVLHNRGDKPLLLEDLWLETATGRQLHHLDLPADAVHGQSLHPEQKLAFGFLRHLLTRLLRGGGRLTGEQIFTACVSARSATAATPDVAARSEELPLSLEYPTHPLEDVELLPYADYFLHRLTVFWTSGSASAALTALCGLRQSALILGVAQKRGCQRLRLLAFERVHA